MCGIIGAIGSFEKQAALEGLDLLSHRGPDSKGYHFSKNVYLGHARLSIQDLSSNGHQPMWTNDGRYVIIFNGEIYNHNELREKYLSNVNFCSNTDTETVLYGFCRLGQDFIPKLNGIFAFAIYDTVEEEVTIARDKYGVKPLYYYENNRSFLFASEIKFLGATIKPV